MDLSKVPRFSTYGKYPGNYGAHCLVMHLGRVSVYHSYDTVVAFDAPDCGLVVRENSWGPTTGKHLNWIDGGDKKGRVDPARFEELWDRHAVPHLAPVIRLGPPIEVIEIYGNDPDQVPHCATCQCPRPAR